jgi:ferric-dicitrate binding protein FerR (iron transport regulator)
LVKQNGLLIYEPAVSGAFRRKKGDMGPVAYNTLTTPRGRQFQVVLSDGSKVWLNAASSITYPTAFTGTKREVSITGEAYFEIKNDARHPFIVAAEDEKITVLGTHFNVMAYPDEGQMKTTLVEGSVRISRGTEKVVITPGQQASFSPKTGHIAVMAVQTPEIIAWVSGKLSLNNLDISAIMRRLARWYNVDVEFEGPVPQGHFWGVINRNVNLSSVLSVMNANGIHAQLEGNKVIVSSK